MDVSEDLLRAFRRERREFRSSSPDIAGVSLCLRAICGRRGGTALKMRWLYHFGRQSLHEELTGS